MTSWSPIAPAALVDRLADLIAARGGIVRVAVDGPPCAEPGALADALVAPLQLRSRPVAHVRAESFWRDASLRLEYGREDVESYASWLDTATLQREVLHAVVERGEYLPSLRDPVSNRSTRVAPQPLGTGGVAIVSGALLLGHELAFDVTVHLAVSSAARARRTPPSEIWTLPAFDAYDAEVRPFDLADVVVRADDPAHPAARFRD